MATLETEKMQQSLDEAFANFRHENPQLAEAMRVLNISYAEYLRVLAALQLELEPSTSSANSQTPA